MGLVRRGERPPQSFFDSLEWRHEIMIDFYVYRLETKTGLVYYGSGSQSRWKVQLKNFDVGRDALTILDWGLPTRAEAFRLETEYIAAAKKRGEKLANKLSIGGSLTTDEAADLARKKKRVPWDQLDQKGRRKRRQEIRAQSVNRKKANEDRKAAAEYFGICYTTVKKEIIEKWRAEVTRLPAD